MNSFPLVSQEQVLSDLARLQTEMDLARRVQFSLFPKIPPSIPGLDLWGVSRPASTLSGDFYDFIARPNQPLTFFVGDVCGMGLPAALLMPMARAILRAEANTQPAPTPKSILQSANLILLDDLVEAEMFVTAFVSQYDPSSRELLYANAGHSPVIYCPAGGRTQLLKADGTALGVLRECFSFDQRLLLNPGDMLIVATDGLNEARNSRCEHFGVARLLNLAQRQAGRSAVEISSSLIQEIRDFCAPEPQADDQTVVILRCTDE
jgi:phosphoserine phosphatase RsbU/P